MIGSNIGTMLEVESDGIMWDKSARVRIMVIITNPLRLICKIRSSLTMGIVAQNVTKKGKFNGWRRQNDFYHVLEY